MKCKLRKTMPIIYKYNHSIYIFLISMIYFVEECYKSFQIHGKKVPCSRKISRVESKD